MSALRTEFASVVLTAFAAVVITWGIGRTTQLGMAHAEVRFVAPW